MVNHHNQIILIKKNTKIQSNMQNRFMVFYILKKNIFIKGISLI